MLRFFFFALVMEVSVNDMLQKKTRVIPETGFANVLQLSFMAGCLPCRVHFKFPLPGHMWSVETPTGEKLKYAHRAEEVKKQEDIRL